MVSLRQKKKQNPARQAWRSFKNMFKSKFRDMDMASSVKESTARVIRFISDRLIVPFRTRYLQNNSYSQRNQTSRRFLNFFSRPITKQRRYRDAYDDDDYFSQMHQYQSKSHSEGTSVRREEKVVVEDEEEERMPEIADSMEDAWRRVVAASPHLRVDERADEFIYKFRESMKMEKEKSFLEFQERLKRGT